MQDNKPQLYILMNLGIGDHIFIRAYLDPIAHKYSQINIAHAKDALAFWFNNDQKRLQFNTQLANTIFSVPPYKFDVNGVFPFFPVERIINEINDKPIKPNLDCLCKGNSLNIGEYIVITTKMRQFPISSFEQMKPILTEKLQNLATKYKIVILGEREVEMTKEYTNSVNRGQVFGIYNYLINILPKDNLLDLSIPALGNTVSTFSQFQQDCLIMKEARAVITFGIGGNMWMSAGVAKKSIGLRTDAEWTTDKLNNGYPGMFLTKDINQFGEFLDAA